MKRTLMALVAAVALTATISRAQTSFYASMTAVGEWQGWNPGANNLYLISNHVWEGVFFIGDRNQNRFKFVPNGGWGTDWGAAITSSIPLYGTLSGVAGLTNVFGADITLTNIIEGFYRYRFHELTKSFEVAYLATAYEGPLAGNSVRNGTFEQNDLGNSELAYAWNYRPAMTAGGQWGNSGRRDWRYVSPFHLFFIGPTFGGIWQDVPGGRDFDYELSAWFWMDGTSNTNFGPWTAAVQQVKIEFYGASLGSPLSVISSNIPFVAESWNKVSVVAAAPTNVAWARAVVSVSGAGPKGSLQIDDVAMKVIPRSAQYFTSWDFARTGTFVRGGWSASNAFMVTSTNLAHAAPTLALRNGGRLLSPRMENGIGRIAFVYRTSFNDPLNDPTDNLTAVVRVSPDGINFTPVATLANIQWQTYREFSLNVDDPSQLYAEVVVQNGTNALLIDDVRFLPAAPDLRFQDYALWTNAAWTNVGYRELNNWQLSSGAIFYAGAYVAPSALLPGRTNAQNFIRTPLFSNGYGEVSFQLARGANGGAAAELRIQESADGSTWTTIGGLSNIVDTAWTPYSLYFYQPLPRYLRIVNASTATPGGTFSTLLVNEGFDNAPAPPPDWTFFGVGVYTTAASSGQSPPSIRLDDTGDYIETPTLIAPTNLQFWMRSQSLSGSYRFEILGLVGGTWSTVQTFTSISGSATYTVPLATNISKVRFLYALKASGNIALDDVVIRGVSVGGQPPQDVLIDNIEIGLPVEFRVQDFEAWPLKSGYSNGVHIFQGWVITNAMVHGDNAYAGKSLRLNTGVSNFFISPVFPEGIGLVSFYYARWPGDTSPTLQLQYSTNGGLSWVSVTNIVATNDAPNYILFQRLLNATGPASVRVLHTAGAGRTLIDNIEIGYPQLPADVTLTGFHDPPNPFTNDTIRLNAVVSPVNGAVVTNVTAFYRFGTNGAFSSLQMTQSNFVYYQTLASLGPHATGTVVQYFFRAQFTGPGADSTSPRFFPAGGSNAPAFYAIPRARPGQVWINEVRYEGWWLDDNDFIELAGPASFNISQWTVEIVLGSTSTFETVLYKYVMPGGSLLTTNAFPFGFWVLGMPEVPNRNYTISNPVGEYLPFGIRLLNEGGGVEDAVCFFANMPGFERVFAEDDLFNPNASVGLQGSSTNHPDFTWTAFSNSTPGSINIGQSFSGSSTNLPPPDAWITRLTWGTNVTITAVGNTNGWNVAPYYTTALTNNATWIPITPFHGTNSGGTNTIWFNLPAQTNWFLRLLYTHP